MIDQRLLAAFDGLDEPVDPDPAFAEALLANLVADLGLGRSAARPRTIGSRMARLLGIEHPPAGRAALRSAYLAAVLGLLMAAMAAALLLAGQLRADPGPDDLVELSKAASQHPPAFTIACRPPHGPPASSPSAAAP